MTIRERLPGIDATAQGGPLQGTIATQASPDGAVSTSVRESVGALEVTMAVDPKAANPSASGQRTTFQRRRSIRIREPLDFKLDGVKPRPLLDLWAFLVAHPSRPELAADEAAFKTLADGGARRPDRVRRRLRSAETFGADASGLIHVRRSEGGRRASRRRALRAASSSISPRPVSRFRQIWSPPHIKISCRLRSISASRSAAST